VSPTQSIRQVNAHWPRIETDEHGYKAGIGVYLRASAAEEKNADSHTIYL
jgi:hypothetical protein